MYAKVMSHVGQHFCHSPYQVRGRLCGSRNPVLCTFFWIPAGVYPVLRYGAGM